MITNIPYNNFYNDYLMKNGMVPSETNINKGQVALKHEIDTLYNIFIASMNTMSAPDYSGTVVYIRGDVVKFGGVGYVSRINSNQGNEPFIGDVDYWWSAPNLNGIETTEW